MESSRVRHEIAEPRLYRIYWGLMLPDILFKTNQEITAENKEALHEFHKRELGYESIAGQSQEVVQKFLFDVCAYWAVEQGIFVRTRRDQPYDIQSLSFFARVKCEDGTYKRVIDLL